MIQPKKAIMGMKAYSPPLEGRRGKLRLDFNENTIGCSPKVMEAIRKLKREDIATYPEYDELIAKLAKYQKADKSQIMVTNGTNEAIKVVFETYIEKGDEIVIPYPTFAVFSLCAAIAEANLKKIMYNSDLSFPTKEVLDSITSKTKLVILVNPNNPTATKIEQKDIIKIIEKAKNSIVLVDEAYFQFINQSCSGLINKYDNLIVMQTFSKAFGLAGLRFGCVISDKENIQNMIKAKLPYSVNIVAITAASAAIDDKLYVKNYVSKIEEGKKIIYNGLGRLNIKTYPSAANFMLADFGKRSKEIQKKLAKKGILVREMGNYPLLSGCLRITIGPKLQSKKFISALKEI